jgi:hypothetical protein
MTLTEELITAAVTATDEKKAAALRVLRGESEVAGLRPEIGVPEVFVTLKECGRRLGLSACSLWRWGVPGHELGGRRKFRMTEVEAYLQSKEFKRKAAGLRKVKTLSSRQVTGQGTERSTLRQSSGQALTPTLSPPRERENSGKTVAA